MMTIYSSSYEKLGYFAEFYPDSKCHIADLFESNKYNYEAKRVIASLTQILNKKNSRNITGISYNQIQEYGKYYVSKLNEYLNKGEYFEEFVFERVIRNKGLDDSDTFPGERLKGYNIKLKNTSDVLYMYLLDDNAALSLPEWLNKENLKFIGVFIYEYLKHTDIEPAEYIIDNNIPMLEDY